MSITREEIIGTKIINEIKSSNLKKTTYDVETHDLIVEFTTGVKYEYKEVPHKIYTKFRLANSQGEFFSSQIARKYNYQKI